jgi:tyrosine-protein kinase Etk/Wzc
MVDHLKAGLSVEPVSKDVSIINISYTGPIVQLNNDIINNLIYQHEQRAIYEKNEITINTSAFIKERMVLIEKELSIVEDSSQLFKTKNRLVDVDKDAAMFLEKESNLEVSITNASIQLTIVEYIMEFIDKSRSFDELLPSNLGFEESTINKLTEEHNKLVLERNRTIEVSSNKNPKVVQLESQIASFRQNLRESLEKHKKQIDVNLSILRQKEAQYRNKIANVPYYEREYREIIRQQQIKETLYLYLLQKREENEIALASTLGSAKILDEAYPQGIVAPKKQVIFLGNILLGLMLPIGIIYLTILLDNKIHRREDLEKTNIPVIGEIPEGEKDIRIVVKKGERTIIAEAFRMLRAQPEFYDQ